MANEQRLINVNVLLDLLRPLEGVSSIVKKVLAIIRNCPTVDAVEVVRCKDCKHREKSPWHDGYRCGNPYDGMASGVELRDDDFCSYGERRDGE